MFFVDLGKQYPGLQEYSRYIYMKQYVTDQAKIISKSVTKIYLINPWLKMTHVTFFLPVFTHNGTPIGILQGTKQPQEKIIKKFIKIGLITL